MKSTVLEETKKKIGVILTPAEVAVLLRIDRSTVYRMIERKEISSIKIGKHVRIKQSEINQLVNGFEN